MKLDVPYKNVGSIPNSLVNEALSTIKLEHWFLDDTRNLMGNLEQTQSIMLRYFSSYENCFRDDWKSHIINKPLFPIYESVIQKFIFELKKYYSISNYMAFFAKLLPNSKVGLHEDSGQFLETCHRIHIPLKTNLNVFYVIENQKYNWLVGNIYEFDNTRTHGVSNESNEERIHLMFNIYS